MIVKAIEGFNLTSVFTFILVYTFGWASTLFNYKLKSYIFIGYQPPTNYITMFLVTKIFL